MRTLLRDLIIQDPALTTLIPAERWKGSGSVTEENKPDTMFAVIRYGIENRGMSDKKRCLVTIWVHDSQGTYEDINKVLDALYGRLNGVAGQQDGSGNEIMSCEWQSNSGDLIDTGFRTITRNATFELIGKGV